MAAIQWRTPALPPAPGAEGAFPLPARTIPNVSAWAARQREMFHTGTGFFGTQQLQPVSPTELIYAMPHPSKRSKPLTIATSLATTPSFPATQRPSDTAPRRILFAPGPMPMGTPRASPPHKTGLFFPPSSPPGGCAASSPVSPASSSMLALASSETEADDEAAVPLQLPALKEEEVAFAGDRRVPGVLKPAEEAPAIQEAPATNPAIYRFDHGVMAEDEARRRHQEACDANLSIARGRRATRSKRPLRQLSSSASCSEDEDHLDVKDGAVSTQCPHCNKDYRQNNR